MSAIEPELILAIQQLDAQQQRRVLDFVRTLQKIQGEPLAQLVEDARRIAFPSESLKEIAQFVEEEFEQVRGDELDIPDFPA